MKHGYRRLFKRNGPSTIEVRRFTMQISRRAAIATIGSAYFGGVVSSSQAAISSVGTYPRYASSQWDQGLLAYAKEALKDRAVAQLLHSVSWPTIPSGDGLRRELNTMLALQAKRDLNPQLVKTIREEYEATLPFLLKHAVGDATDSRCGNALAFFTSAARPYYMAAKLQFSRQRADVLEPKLRPCIPVCNFASFPSGHTAQATLAAVVIGKMYPDRAKQAMAVATSMALHGEAAGSHFPTDSEAGHLLGLALAKQFSEEIDRRIAA